LDKEKNGSPLARLRPSKRKLIQLYAALLYNANIKGFAEGQIYTGPIKNVCVPGLNCYSCPGAIGACPLGALQNALASSTTRAPTYVLGILCLFGLALGRTICGFLCPFGLIQELLYKIPSPKLKKSRGTRMLSWLKYLILATLVLAVPLACSLQHFPVPGFCKYICPAGTLEGAIGLLSNPGNADKLSMLNILFTRKFVILMLILAGSVFVFRIFCRFICPLGAIYGLFCKVALVGVRVDSEKCTGCGVCVRRCKMDVKRVGDHECINCGECIGACPTKAIAFTACGKRFEARPEEKRPLQKRLLPWVLALAVLGGVLWYVNKPAKELPQEAPVATEQPAEETAAPEETEQPDAEPALEVGKDPGMLLPDFTAKLYGGGEFNTEGERGKVLVINFWATWCTPCVNELPYFAQLAADYRDNVSVIALHSSLVTEDVDAWLAREQIPLCFALDETGDIITSLGGSTMLPMTVVVSPEGVICYNAVGSVTYEKLVGLVEAAMN